MLLAGGPARLLITAVADRARPVGVVVTVEVGRAGGGLRLAGREGPRTGALPARPSGAQWREPGLGSTGRWPGSPATSRGWRILRRGPAAGGGRPARSTLVMGEPGIGKAAAVRAVHGELRPTARWVVVECCEGAATVRAGLAEVRPARGEPAREPRAAPSLLRHLERLDAARRRGAAPAARRRPTTAPGGSSALVSADGVAPGARGRGEVLDVFENQVGVSSRCAAGGDDVPLSSPALLARLAPGAESGCSPEAGRLLAGGLWPGNVRELEDVLRRALAQRRPATSRPATCPAEFAVHGTRRRLSPLEAAERDLIV